MSLKSQPCRNPSATFDIDDAMWARFADEEGWSIRVKARPVINLPGPKPVHAYLSFHAPDGTLISELHGLPFVRESGKVRGHASFAKNFDTLRATFTERAGNELVLDKEIWSGNAHDFMAHILNSAALGQQVNSEDIHYMPHVPLVTARNSNFVSGNMITEAMGLELPDGLQGYWWDALVGTVMNLRRQFGFFSDGRKVQPQILAPGLSRSLSESFSPAAVTGQNNEITAKETDEMRTSVRFALRAMSEEAVGEQVRDEQKQQRREEVAVAQREPQCSEAVAALV